MPVITIRELSASSHIVAIDNQEFPVTLLPPFDEKQEAELEWYFEEHLRFPFTNQVRAERAARTYGQYRNPL